MWDMFWEVLGFLLKSGIVLVVIVMIIAIVKGGTDEDEPTRGGQLLVKHLNEELRREARRFRSALVPQSARAMAEKAYDREEKIRKKVVQKQAKQTLKDHKRQTKTALKESNNLNTMSEDTELNKAQDQEGKLQFSERPRLFVLDFVGDIQASAVEALRREVSAILDVINENDRVLLKLYNSGGYVHTHGLAASQLKRLRDASVELWVSVDQVAASGGYLMACVAERIYAAPFSVIGSIGVMAQLPNVNRLLKRFDVDVELHTAGKYKRTLTTLGENTEEGREKFIEDLNITHELFKNFVAHSRPTLDIERVATGETWLGTQALEVGLIDEIKTSDELILEALAEYEVYSVNYMVKRKLSERFLSVAHTLFSGRLPSRI